VVTFTNKVLFFVKEASTPKGKKTSRSKSQGKKGKKTHTKIPPQIFKIFELFEELKDREINIFESPLPCISL
jgi:hypothetical protein